MPSERFALGLKPDREAPLTVADWVGTAAAALALGGDLTFKIDLCLAEAVANVVDHAGASQLELDLGLDLTGSTVTATVEDDGAPFNPLDRPPPARPISIEDAPIGGLGIHLVRNCTDEVAYEYRDGRNRLTMVWRR